MGRQRAEARRWVSLSLALLLVLAVAACGDLSRGSDTYGGDSGGTPDSSDPGDEQELAEGDAATVRGEVVENTIDPCRFPDEDVICEEGGGHFLRLQAGDRLVSVYYAGHEGEPCRNEAATEQAADARVGTTVEVHAEVESADDSEATLSVCGSDDYSVEHLD